MRAKQTKPRVSRKVRAYSATRTINGHKKVVKKYIELTISRYIFLQTNARK
jgi:hypothetical protein